VTAPVDVAAAVHKGVRLFNHGRYLDAQQVWEAAWRCASPADRAFLEALVQLGAGLHLRTRRGAGRGAVHLLSQAMVALDDYQPSTFGVDVTVTIAEFTAYVDWLRTIDRPHRLLDRLRIPRLR
jgi:predicted metal-dependent hydrolase